MLYRSSILAISGSGRGDRFPRDAVTLYDDQSSRKLGEISFRNPVQNIAMTRDKIIAVTAARVYVYSLTDLRPIDSFETVDNTTGIVAVHGERDALIAAPTQTPGEI